MVNIIKFFFLNCTLLIGFFGFVVNIFESYLPTIIRQSFCYGKLSNNCERNRFISRLEVPKSWFRHFYIFGSIWSLLAISLVVKGLINESSAPDYVIDFLDFFAGGEGRKALINSTSGLLALVLITTQVLRRAYETYFVQIFSSQSKMNLFHYMLGLAHYIGIVAAVLANTEGFVRDTVPQVFAFSTITRTQYICCFIFYFSWLQQSDSHRILANLRRDDAGNQDTEEHIMPYDRFFEYVSSPHMLFEVVIYVAIYGVIPTCNTWQYIIIWVVINQTESAWLTHLWYKKNIKNYPKERYAIYPYIL